MTSLCALLICMLAGPGQERVELALPDLSLVPPAGLERVRVEPPSLFEGVFREKTQQRARLALFVLPAPAGAPPKALAEAARRVSAAYTSVPLEGGAPEPPESPEPPEPPEPSDRLTLLGSREDRRARLEILPLGERSLGLLLFGEAETVEDLEDVFLETVGSITVSGLAHPSGLDARLKDGGTGFALEVPVGFERSSDPESPVLAAAHLPYHFGISAWIAVRWVDSNLDEPLAPDGQTSESVAGAPPQRELTRLVDLAHHRVRISCSAPADRFERYRAAFEHALSSFSRQPRRLEVALAPRYRDTESGFSIRPPAGFVRAGGFEDTLVTFQEQHSLPPAYRLEVRGIPAEEAPVEAGETLRAAEAFVDLATERGQSRLGPLQPQLLNGMQAVSFGLAGGDRPGDAAELHWMISTGDRLLDLVFVLSRGDLPIYEPLLRASVISFQALPATHAPALAPASPVADGRASIRPPLDWSRVETLEPEHLVSYRESEDAAASGELEVGIEPLPAQVQRLAGLADSYRREVIARLESRGLRAVRVESGESSTEGSRVHIRLRLAYSRDGRAMLELRRAILTDVDVVYARAVAPTSRFHDYQLLFQAALGSLRITEE